MNRGMRLTAWLGLAVAAVVTLVPSASPPAAAAGGDIPISRDGVTWSTSLGQNIFDTSRVMVPGDSLRGSFYVKNDNDFPAYLRVGLSALAVTDWTLAQAISLTTIGTGASGASGSAAALSGTGVVCSDLLQREDPVPPGGVVLISADLLFRQSTSGTTAQGQIAQIGFIVEFSDVDLNSFGQPLCTNTARIGPPDPNFGPTPGPGSTTSPTTPGGTLPVTGGGSGTPGPGAVPGSGDDATNGQGPGSEQPSGVPGTGSPFDRPAASGTIEVDGPIGLDTTFFNTVRWWEEYAILVPIAAGLLGMLLRVYTERRRMSREARVGQE